MSCVECLLSLHSPHTDEPPRSPHPLARHAYCDGQDANRIGGGPLIAAGAVAVITDSPTDAQHAYKVRCNDGAEAMLRRNEFSILKEFKNVPERGCVADQPQHIGNAKASAADAPHTAALHNSDFLDWKPFIIYRCVVGSQAFGLSGDDSDVDRRGIYLPPAELHWSLYGVPQQIENNDTQEAYWELQKFLVMALKANPNILAHPAHRARHAAGRRTIGSISAP